MEEVRENKMGTQPIGDLLFKMSLPIMISMLVQALYNIVDSIFVAKISEDALTAVSLAFDSPRCRHWCRYQRTAVKISRRKELQTSQQRRQ